MSDLTELQERHRVVTDRVRVAILIDDDLEDYEDALTEQDALQDLIQEFEQEEAECDECRIDTSEAAE